MNNKGFMMVELVVVSSIVVVTLTALYISFNKIMISYDEIIDYNDVGTMYRLGYYYKSKVDGKIEKLDDDYKKLATSVETFNNISYLDNAYIVKVNKLDVLKNKVVEQEFKDYITYVNENISDAIDCILIMSRCYSKDENEELYVCKYAYMDANVEVTYVEE